MTKTCQNCSQTFQLAQPERDHYQRFKTEPTGLCFVCDQKQRLCFRSEWNLYQRKCDGSGEDIISIYQPNTSYPVYKSNYWYSDIWNPLNYGRDYNPRRSFFEQFAELQAVVPRLALSNIKGDNSEYCNMTYGNKNSYLVFGGDWNEDVMFNTLGMRNKNSLDLDYSNKNELCYMLLDSDQCYGCQFVSSSKNCTNCFFISDCSGCTECILSTNLINKSYYIYNQPYSKEDYLKKKKQLLNDRYEQQQHNIQAWSQLRQQRKVKYANTVSCEQCSGDYIKNSQRCHHCFDVSASEQMTNVIFAVNSRDCLNSSLQGDNSELCYNAISTYQAYNIQHSFFVIDSSDVTYSEFILNSKNIFGSIGLRHQEYCILNKRYRLDEYEKLRINIIQQMRRTSEWGQFFPKQLACFGYNETTAQICFPLDKITALAQGFRWFDESNRITNTRSEQTSECQQCYKMFKFLNEERAFYQAQQLPLPRICPKCRHIWRMTLRNPRQLWNRQCVRCSITVQSTYSPDRKEIVYCEQCYAKEIY
ncbi:MAG: hypothetical protein HYV33_05000 [Candidatus Kerfeldbacteria bacterium]|nr:hypothetical protein [Candidatus Kerfeldbacteria bacterium]